MIITLTEDWTAEAVEQVFGVNPDHVGIRNRGWFVDYRYAGDERMPILFVCARDPGIGEYDEGVMEKPNYLHMEYDDTDWTYCYYKFRPLTEEEQPDEPQPDTQHVSGD